MNRTLAIVLTVLWVMAAALSCFLAMMSFFLFDSPGSENSRWTIALFVASITMPVFWIAGAILPWLLYKRAWAAWLFAVPLIDVAAFAAILAGIDRFCGGNFSCR